jgi:anti-sigma regulatory factor (Ser/Thr protein kinase)
MVSESFTPSPSEISAARHFALAAAEHLGCCPTDLGLVVSELATNACVHARSPFTVTVERRDAGLLVEVADDDPAPVTVRHAHCGCRGQGVGDVARRGRQIGLGHPGLFLSCRFVRPQPGR